MTKKWTIEFTERADQQFGKLDKTVQKRIQIFLKEKLSKRIDPRQLGQGLTGNLSSFWRYCISDYRLLCSIKNNELTILVVQIGHRRDIYH